MIVTKPDFKKVLSYECPGLSERLLHQSETKNVGLCGSGIYVTMLTYMIIITYNLCHTARCCLQYGVYLRRTCFVLSKQTTILTVGNRTVFTWLTSSSFILK